MSASRLKIDQKIVSWSIRQPDTIDGEKPEPPIVTYNRDEELEGCTYKIKPPTINCAMYITINHVTLPDGTKRPLEMFINSKHPDQHQWVASLTRMISAVFRKPGPIEFVIEELEEVYDPNGGYWVGRKMVPSITAHVGSILRKHCEKIGAIEPRGLTDAQLEVIEEKVTEASEAGTEMRLCGKCNEKAAIMMDGCLTCTSCGESKCG